MIRKESQEQQDNSDLVKLSLDTKVISSEKGNILTSSKASSILQKIPKGYDESGNTALKKVMSFSGKLARGLSLHRIVTKINDSGKMIKFLESRATGILGKSVSLKGISNMSGDIFKSYDSYIKSPENKDRFDTPEIKEIIAAGENLADGMNSRCAEITQAMSDFRSMKIAEIESTPGLSWKTVDDAYTIARYMMSTIEDYFDAYTDIVKSIGVIDPKNEDPKVIASNRGALLALSKASSISELLGAGFRSSYSSSDRQYSSSLRHLPGFSISFPGAEVHQEKTRSEKNSSVENPKTVKIVFENGIKDKNIFSNTENTPDAKNIYISRDFLDLDSDLENIELSRDGKTLILKGKASKLPLQPFLRIKNSEGKIFTPGSFEIDGQPALTNADFNAIKKGKKSVPTDPATNNTQTNDLIDKTSSLTQSTYYKIPYGNKSIQTTLSEYIANNGYYNIDGKKVKLSLSKAKPVGISDAKKRT